MDTRQSNVNSLETEKSEEIKHFLDPDGGSQNATLVVLVPLVVVISSLKMPKAQRNETLRTHSCSYSLLSGVFHHLTVTTRSTKLRPRHAFIFLFGVNLCILVYQSLPESDSGCFELTAWSTKPFLCSGLTLATGSNSNTLLGDEKRDLGLSS